MRKWWISTQHHLLLISHGDSIGHFKLIGGDKGLPLVACALKEGRKDNEGNNCV